MDIENWLSESKKNADTALADINRLSSEMNTIDLLASIIHYNHQQDPKQYSDYRNDRNFYIPEVLSIILLKNRCNIETELSGQEFHERVSEIQKLLNRFCSLESLINLDNSNEEGSVENKLSKLLAFQEKTIRNPGHPEHHFDFMEELFKPIDHEIKDLLGFSIYDSLVIRDNVIPFIHEKMEGFLTKIENDISEVMRCTQFYKSTKSHKEQSIIEPEDIEYLATLKPAECKRIIKDSITADGYRNLKSVYLFRPEEISEFTDLDVETVKIFLDIFSINFEDIEENEIEFDSVSKLKSTPIIKIKTGYIIPSIPLMNFCVENKVESLIKAKTKLYNKYINRRHEFLLDKGLGFFQEIFTAAEFSRKNLFYKVDNKTYEVDGLIKWENVLFIIEAKGNKISDKAKTGHVLKLKDHLKDIVKESNTQAKRAFDYISNNANCEFFDKKKKKFLIENRSVEFVIFVSLTLEPIGNLSIKIRQNEDHNYFHKDHFPFIMSLYDLIHFVEFCNNPIFILHYIKKRKDIVNKKLFSAFEELDLFSYYLQNRLNFQSIENRANEDGVNLISLENATDEFNNYYMHKYYLSKHMPLKPRISIDPEFEKIIQQLHNQNIPKKLLVIFQLLEGIDFQIKRMMKAIKRIKKKFKKNKSDHDCTIIIDHDRSIGFTFMTSLNQEALGVKMNNYCLYKMRELNIPNWIGLGDVCLETTKYKFGSLFISIDSDSQVMNF